jgi:hypothetical protein
LQDNQAKPRAKERKNDAAKRSTAWHQPFTFETKQPSFAEGSSNPARHFALEKAPHVFSLRHLIKSAGQLTNRSNILGYAFHA